MASVAGALSVSVFLQELHSYVVCPLLMSSQTPACGTDVQSLPTSPPEDPSSCVGGLMLLLYIAPPMPRFTYTRACPIPAETSIVM